MESDGNGRICPAPIETIKGMIVRLDKVQPFDEKGFEAKKTELAQQIGARKNRTVYCKALLRLCTEMLK